MREEVLDAVRRDDLACLREVIRDASDALLDEAIDLVPLGSPSFCLGELVRSGATLRLHHIKYTINEKGHGGWAHNYAEILADSIIKNFGNALKLRDIRTYLNCGNKIFAAPVRSRAEDMRLKQVLTEMERYINLELERIMKFDMCALNEKLIAMLKHVTHTHLTAIQWSGWPDNYKYDYERSHAIQVLMDNPNLQQQWEAMRDNMKFFKYSEMVDKCADIILGDATHF
jgi:hypothetical protein